MADSSINRVPNGGKDLLAASIMATAEIAMGLISNRYSSQLPLVSIMIMCALPLVLSLIWLFRKERETGKLKKISQQHPISYSIIAIVAIAFFWNTGAILTSRVSGALKGKTAIQDAGKSPTSSPSNSQAPADVPAATLSPPSVKPPPPKPSRVQTKSSPIPVPSPAQQVISAPNGIAIGGGTVTNPTVNNNFGSPQPPPKAHMLNQVPASTGVGVGGENSAIEEVDSGLTVNPGVTMQLSVDGEFTNPAFRAICDRPCVFNGASVAPGFVEWPPTILPRGYDKRDTVIKIKTASIDQNSYVSLVVRSMDKEKIRVFDISSYVELVSSGPPAPNK
jgi:hypothetical protein